MRSFTQAELQLFVARCCLQLRLAAHPFDWSVGLPSQGGSLEPSKRDVAC